MKLLITVLLSIFLMQHTYAQLPGANYPGDKLQKKALKITTFRYSKNYNGLYHHEMDTTFRDTSFYDDQGHLTERHVKYGPWGHYTYQNYTYQHKFINGKIAETTTLIAGEKIVTSYDENGFIAESDRYCDDGRFFKDVYTYDDKNRLVKCDSYNKKGRMMQTVYKYNKKHLLEEKVNDGMFPAKETYDFSKVDKAGNWTVCISKRYAEAFLLNTGKPGVGVTTETTERIITYYQ